LLEERVCSVNPFGPSLKPTSFSHHSVKSLHSSASRHADNEENQAKHQIDKEQEFGDSLGGHSDTSDSNVCCHEKGCQFREQSWI